MWLERSPGKFEDHRKGRVKKQGALSHHVRMFRFVQHTDVVDFEVQEPTRGR